MHSCSSYFQEHNYLSFKISPCIKSHWNSQKLISACRATLLVKLCRVLSYMQLNLSEGHWQFITACNHILGERNFDSFKKKWFCLICAIASDYSHSWNLVLNVCLRNEVTRCLLLFSLHFLASDDYVIVSTPPFAESVTEGDVRWDKGK